MISHGFISLFCTLSPCQPDLFRVETIPSLLIDVTSVSNAFFDVVSSQPTQLSQVSDLYWSVLRWKYSRHLPIILTPLVG
uniref:Uncharacterized protein n=1 Tax=Lepeophtheirus salmonis TaxID=72036 RepID=A0A0K2TPQ4_LEPSM